MIRLVRRDDGAAAVEFALVFPVLVALLFGIIDFACLFMADQDVVSASREGARYALSGSRHCDSADIRTAAMASVARSTISSAEVTIHYDHGPGSTQFDVCPTASPVAGAEYRIAVTVGHTVTPILPLFSPVTVSATERRTITVGAGP